MSVDVVPGNGLLRRWIAAEFGRGVWLAEALGVSRQAVFIWSNRGGLPRSKYRDLLAALTDYRVPAESWESVPAVVGLLRELLPHVDLRSVGHCSPVGCVCALCRARTLVEA